MEETVGVKLIEASLAPLMVEGQVVATTPNTHTHTSRCPGNAAGADDSR